MDLGELSSATRAALLELAAEVADAFPRDPRPMAAPYPGSGQAHGAGRPAGAVTAASVLRRKFVG